MSSSVVNTTATKAQVESPTFLSLAPIMSESYPSRQVGRQSPEIEALLKARRSSSISSTGSDSSSSKNRFLKLVPVHWGGLPGDSDFAEEAIEFTPEHAPTQFEG
ncbi:MAG: hypothetical protein M1819_000650 [Sarea resinae]|nr:MAG: hypothetical protein M1819_000650 [Sarea resinae]